MIRGKIIRILSDTEVILGVGKNDGVEPNMEFVIFAEGEQILDPESGKQLGVIETVKGRVRVSNVQENFSRAETRTYQVTRPSQSTIAFLETFSRISGDITSTYKDKLKVDLKEVHPLKEVEMQVKVGDFVRSV